MSAFKRFCYIFFFLASVLGVGALAVVWLGLQPVSGVLEGWMGQVWFPYVELALLAILALGLVVVFLRALFTRGTHANLESDNAYGSVFIARPALERTVERTVNAHDDLTFIDAHVRVNNGRKPYIFIRAEVIPHNISNLGEFGPSLQQEIKEVMETLTGETVKKVTVDFREETPSAVQEKEL